MCCLGEVLFFSCSASPSNCSCFVFFIFLSFSFVDLDLNFIFFSFMPHQWVESSFEQSHCCCIRIYPHSYEPSLPSSVGFIPLTHLLHHAWKRLAKFAFLLFFYLFFISFLGFGSSFVLFFWWVDRWYIFPVFVDISTLSAHVNIILYIFTCFFASFSHPALLQLKNLILHPFIHFKGTPAWRRRRARPSSSRYVPISPPHLPSIAFFITYHTSMILLIFIFFFVCLFVSVTTGHEEAGGFRPRPDLQVEERVPLCRHWGLQVHWRWDVHKHTNSLFG